MSKPKEQPPEILKVIQSLCRSTEIQYSATTQVRRAFLLGLWYRAFPPYMLEHLGTLYTWDLSEIAPEASKGLEAPDNGFKFQFIADTGDSWHQCYRDLRERGWQRLKVHRNGGRLQYLFKLSAANLVLEPGWYPEGFTKLHLLLDISISTCKQVQIGTETKEVPIMKTVCEDLIDIPEADEGGTLHYPLAGVSISPLPSPIDKYSLPTELPPVEAHNQSEEFASLLGVSGLDEESLDDPQEPSKSLTEGESFDGTDHYDNFKEQGAPRQFQDDIPF